MITSRPGSGRPVPGSGRVLMASASPSVASCPYLPDETPHRNVRLACRLTFRPRAPSYWSRTARHPEHRLRRGITSMEENVNSVLATETIPDHLAGTWKADPAHSEVAFSVRHLMVS